MVLASPSRSGMCTFVRSRPDAAGIVGITTSRAGRPKSIPLPALSPDTVFLFQEPPEKISETVAELEERIQIIAAREFGHHLGLSDEEPAELGSDYTLVLPSGGQQMRL